MEWQLASLTADKWPLGVLAVALVVEDALSGGTSAAPRVKRLLEGMFGISVPEPEDSQG